MLASQVCRDVALTDLNGRILWIERAMRILAAILAALVALRALMDR